MNLPLCIVLLYVVLLFAVSFYVSHKQRNNKESLLLYKGQNNTLIVAASVAGLAIGGASTIGISENAFAAGLSAGWYDTAWAIGAVIAGLFVVDRLRRGNYDTISDLIGDLYGSRTRILMVITMCLIQSGIIALQYKAGGSILAALLPNVFTVQSGTFFSFVIFVLVAAIGGMGSVTLTNVLNIILIYVGVISATLIVLLQRGGLQAVKAMEAAEPQMHYLSPTAGMGWIGIASWIIVLICTTSSVQGVVQIGLTGKDDRASKRGYLLGALLMIPIGFICALLGVVAKALMPGADAATALPQILMDMPPLLAGITLSGLWAADMGTGCSMVVGLATTIRADILDRTETGKRLTKEKKGVNTVIIVLSGIITYVVATQMGTILGALQKALSLSIGLAFMVLFGLLAPGFASKKAGFITTIVAIIGLVLWNLLPSLAGVFPSVAFFMLALCAVTFLGLSALLPDKVKQSVAAGKKVSAGTVAGLE